LKRSFKAPQIGAFLDSAKLNGALRSLALLPLMTKKEACELLDVSERTLDKYAREGRLTVQYLPGKTGRRADFDQDELERLKVELEAPQPTATGLYTLSSDGSTATPQTGAIVPLRGSARVGSAAPLLVLSPEHIPALAKALSDGREGVRVAERLTLDIDGAFELSGISRGVIRAAIADKTLPARRIGRGWKIERAALEKWVKSLFTDGDA